ELEPASRYLEQAGDAARARAAQVEAGEAYQQAVVCLDRLGLREQAASVREKWGEVLAFMGRYDEALAVLEQAVEVDFAAREAEGELRALAKMGMTYRWRGTSEEGLKRLRVAIDRLPAQGDSRGAAAFSVALAQLYVGIDQYHEMLAAAEQ